MSSFWLSIGVLIICIIHLPLGRPPPFCWAGAPAASRRFVIRFRIIIIILPIIIRTIIITIITINILIIEQLLEMRVYLGVCSFDFARPVLQRHRVDSLGALG